GILLLAIFYGRSLEIYPKKPLLAVANNKILALCVFFIAVIAFTWLFFLTRQLQHAVLIDIHYSDIISAVQIMVKRFLHGADPYAPLSELGYSTPADYMPMHCLPYTIAEIGNKDYRYITFGIWTLAVIVVFVRSYLV